MRFLSIFLVGLGLSGCSDAVGEQPFDVQEIATFDEPWAMSFLPNGSMLVSEKSGTLFVVSPTGEKQTVLGVPDVDYGGQGGFGDVTPHPAFADNGMLYFSYVEAGEDDTRGAVAARGILDLDTLELSGVETIWTQTPKTTGKGHYGHRLLFGPDGYLWISSGDRQKFDPSQDMDGNLGKVLRLNDDGSPADGNPFQERGGVSAEIWSLGHRNPLGIDFDAQGRLWNSEMGPRGGDELNLVTKGANYGYPIVSNGRHYSGKDMPDHDTRPEFSAPAVWWTPVISPGNLLFYSGDEFPAWQGNALLPGLSSKALVRVEIDGDTAREVARYDMGKRIRSVEQGQDGALWLLEDQNGGRLLKLTAARGD